MKTMSLWLAVLTAVALAGCRSTSGPAVDKTQLRERTEKVISDWQPKDCKNEDDYEKSLFAELQKAFLDAKDPAVQRQWARGVTRVDIVIGETVAIEIKRDMKESRDCERAIGQVEQDRSAFHHVFLVVCGESRENYLQELKKQLQGKENVTLFVK